MESATLVKLPRSVNHRAIISRAIFVNPSSSIQETISYFDHELFGASSWHHAIGCLPRTWFLPIYFAQLAFHHLINYQQIFHLVRWITSRLLLHYFCTGCFDSAQNYVMVRGTQLQDPKAHCSSSISRSASSITSRKSLVLGVYAKALFPCILAPRSQLDHIVQLVVLLSHLDSAYRTDIESHQLN